MRTARLVFAAALLAACAKPETPEQASARMAAETDSAKTAIEAIDVRWSHFVSANLADSAAALFMETGVMMPPNAAAVSGRAAIRTASAAMAMPPGATLTLHSADVMASGPIAIERGTFAFAIPAQGRTPAVSSQGKYLTHWHKVGGQWMVAADIWSDDAASMPMPAPPPARR